MTGIKVGMMGAGLATLGVALPVVAQSNADAIAEQGIVGRAFEFLATGSMQVVMSVAIVALTFALVRVIIMYRKDTLAGQAKIEKLLVDSTSIMTDVKNAMEWCKERHKA